MKLADFYAKVTPFLLGSQDHATTVRALWGESAPEQDAARLAIYGRFCRVHRFEAVDSVYAYTREALVALAGQPAWDELVEAYFVAHPMHHVEINENGSELAPFLGTRLGALQLPAWLAGLAELEWWEWRTRIAPDHADDTRTAEGKLRITSTAELRPFTHDFVGWIDDGERKGAPEAGQTLVLFWRDLELSARRELATADDLQVLKAVSEGLAVDAAGPLGETLADLRNAGIVLGAA